MESDQGIRCTAFAGMRRVADGPLAEVARAVRAALAGGGTEGVLFF